MKGERPANRVDEKTLRLEQILLDVRTNEMLVDLQARRHVAAFAVGLTAGTGAVAAAAGGHLDSTAALSVASGAGALVASQLRALGRQRAYLEAGRQKAREAIETLITSEVEPDVDAPSEAQS